MVIQTRKTKIKKIILLYLYKYIETCSIKNHQSPLQGDITDFGIIILDHRLTWSKYCEELRVKALRYLDSLLPRSSISLKIKLNLYKPYFRPVVACAAPAPKIFPSQSYLQIKRVLTVKLLKWNRNSAQLFTREAVALCVKQIVTSSKCAYQDR